MRPRPRNELKKFICEFTNLTDERYRYEYREREEHYIVVGNVRGSLEYVPVDKVTLDGTILTNRTQLLVTTDLDKLIHKKNDDSERWYIWSYGLSEDELNLRKRTLREKIDKILANKERQILQMQHAFVNSTGFKPDNEVALDRTIMLCINCYWWNYVGANEGLCGCKNSKFYRQRTKNNFHCVNFKMDMR